MKRFSALAFNIDILVLLLSMMVAWGMAAGYRISGQVPLPPQSSYITFGFLFLTPSFMLLDYLRLRLGGKFTLAVAALAVVVSFSVNQSVYSENSLRFFGILLTTPVAVLIGIFIQKQWSYYPLWQLAVATHVITNVAHSILFNAVTRHDNPQLIQYIYASISGKFFMFLFTLPILIGMLSLTFDDVRKSRAYNIAQLERDTYALENQ